MTENWHQEFEEALGESWDDPPDIPRLEALLEGVDITVDSGFALGPARISWLYWVATRRQVEALEFLLSRGADPNLDGALAPIHAAGNPIDGAFGAPLDRAERCIARLIDHGADVEVPGPRGETPLFTAIGGDGISLVATRALLERGADPRAANDDGVSLLEWAAVEHESPRAVALLLEHGADPTVAASTGGSIFERARERRPAHDRMRPARPAEGSSGRREDRDGAYRAEVRAYARGETGHFSGLVELLEETQAMKCRCIAELLREAMMG